MVGTGSADVNVNESKSLPMSEQDFDNSGQPDAHGGKPRGMPQAVIAPALVSEVHGSEVHHLQGGCLVTPGDPPAHGGCEVDPLQGGCLVTPGDPPALGGCEVHHLQGGYLVTPCDPPARGGCEVHHLQGGCLVTPGDPPAQGGSEVLLQSRI